MGLRNRNILVGEQFYFVTTTVRSFTNIFVQDKYFNILINNLKHYQKKYKIIILGYIIMPSHFHWIVQVDQTKGTISDIMRDIKKYSAWDIMEIVNNMNKKDFIETFERNAVGYRDRKRKFWKKRFDDQVVRDQKMFWTKLKYIHNNPVKAGLVEKPKDYKYSSARNYIQKDHSIIYVDTSWGGIEII